MCVVYRPHRRAVTMSLDAKFERMRLYRYPRVALQARLGCPEARAYVRKSIRDHCRSPWRKRGQPWWRAFGLHDGDVCDLPADAVPDERAIPWPETSGFGDLPENFLGTGII